MALQDFCLIINAFLYIIQFGSIYTDGVQLAILHLQSPFGNADVCALYNPYYSAIPEKLENAPKLNIYVPDDSSGCSDYLTRSPLNITTIVTADGNCSFFQKLQKAYQAGAKQVVVLSKSGLTDDLPKGTPQEHKQIHLSVAMIRTSTWNTINKDLDGVETTQLYHPHDPIFDPNLIAIWIIAVFTVVVGAYWCGLTFEKSEKERMNSSETRENESEEFPITTMMVVVFIVMICVMLLLLYFFYKYLIYVVIGLFAIATVSGTFHCLCGIMSFINCGRCRLPENNLPLLNEQFEVREIVLLFFCIGLSVYWVIIRNTNYGWVLQDFLGVCFCISLIKFIRLPNMKIGTFLLLALLVYDIFFVFITPLFSARGKSVMVEVATGNGSSEQLPMVIRIPKFIKTALSICERPYSLLGFGDILLPGLFVAFCHNFDVIAKTKCKVYFLASSIAYGIGLAVTFIALIVMQEGQPALLYLSPAVLLSATIVGYLRGELKALWKGRVEIPYDDENEDNEEQRLVTNSNPSYGGQ